MGRLTAIVLLADFNDLIDLLLAQCAMDKNEIVLQTRQWLF
jgi:hypothetical protein